MALILCIETGTSVCSVALADGDRLLGLKEAHDEKAHAARLTVLIGDLLEEKGVSMSSIDAVAVGKGPGSYTGLRIGVSTAKGICYALDRPLIAVGSLDSMVWGAKALLERKRSLTPDFYCPMIDARRMEVYTALFDPKGDQVMETRAMIIEEDAFHEVLEKNRIVFFGSGASKSKSLIASRNAIFLDDFSPSAQFMVPLAQRCYSNNRFEDVAYFEPYYLKDFVATKPKNKVIPGLG